MNKIIVLGLVICGILALLVGNTHRLLPADSDPCQQDMTHNNHIADLPMFHCIGHTEYEVEPGKDGLDAIRAWDHIHPWMDIDWHISQGFNSEQAPLLLNKMEK